VHDQLRKVIDALDPISQLGTMFDPSDPRVLGRLIALALITQPRRELATIRRFYGSGVYAIYYNGGFQAYGPLAGSEHPIYVGKADPARAESKTAVEQGERLSKRLGDHRKNLAKASSTFRLEDFQYRALVVQSGWQGPAEEYLISLFQPLWNVQTAICYGFGKHGDDPQTRANLRSPWDTLHPGRDWAHRSNSVADAKSADRIISEIAQHLRDHPPFETVDAILRRFLDDLGVHS
jgi:hypothetical protein